MNLFIGGLLNILLGVGMFYVYTLSPNPFSIFASGLLCGLGIGLFVQLFVESKI